MNNINKISGIGERYYNVCFKCFKTPTAEQKELKEKGIRFANAIKAGNAVTFILCGGVGTGKTAIAACILQDVMTTENNTTGYKERFNVCNHFTGRYIKALDIANAIKQAQSFGEGRSLEKIITDFASYDLLVIDEIGTGGNSESAALYEVIDKRYRTRKSTMLITNLTWGKLAEYLGERIMSRIEGNFSMWETKGISDQRPVFDR